MARDVCSVLKNAQHRGLHTLEITYIISLYEFGNGETE
jgi:hypothetical protein